MNNIDVEEEMKEINEMIGEEPVKDSREYKVTNLVTGEETTILGEDLDDAVDNAIEDNLSVLFSMRCPNPEKCQYPNEPWHHGVVITHGKEFTDPRISSPPVGLNILSLMMGGGDDRDEQ